MGNSLFESLAGSIRIGAITLFLTFSGLAKEENPAPPKLEDAFANQSAEAEFDAPTSQEEVEPIVVGRKQWSEPPSDQKLSDVDQVLVSSDSTLDATPIDQLDALETKQAQLDGSSLPLKPPSPAPAVSLHRNFEGTLVLKPRKLGLQREFPFQLENARGRRLAYVDTEGLKIVDPVEFKDRKVNLLGKLEPLEEGSKDLVIRARLLRPID
jgi:hypothetical protein